MYLARPVSSVRQGEGDLEGIIEGRAGGQAGSVDPLIPSLFYFTVVMIRHSDGKVPGPCSLVNRGCLVGPARGKWIAGVIEPSTTGYRAVTVIGLAQMLLRWNRWGGLFLLPSSQHRHGQLNLSGDFSRWP